jgi:hypothetical protein
MKTEENQNKLSNMSQANFSTVIEVSQSPEEVFSCISNVPKWWSKDYQGDSKHLNDEFIIHHPMQHHSKQRLVEVIPNKKIVWLITESTLYWLQGNKEEWKNTRIIFDIESANEGTILHFTHEGLTPDKECFSMCEKGWSIVINEWLHHFITHGAESPEMNRAAQIRNDILDQKPSE